MKNKDRSEVIFKYESSEKTSGFVIESDLVRLTQIMQNLINNAVKFTSKGEISIGFYPVGDTKVSMYVKDTGTGIEKKNFEIIFDQFRQIDGSNIRKYGGTGLGLAICKNLTELLNGKIWLESEKGRGSSFFVDLPIRSGYLIKETRVDEDALPSISKKTTVLLVDDDQDTLMLLVTLLRNEGIQTITADSGYKALEILERELRPNVVLLDLQMPVLSGMQTLKIIKELYPDQKVIAQSAHALEGDKSKSLFAGFDDYITKPYSKQALLKVLQKVISN
jgi:CheY-like chemotaxis protein